MENVPGALLANFLTFAYLFRIKSQWKMVLELPCLLTHYSKPMKNAPGASSANFVILILRTTPSAAGPF